MQKSRTSIFLLVLLITLTTNVFSQEFNAGIYGGIVASQLDGDTYVGYDKAGLITGAYVNRHFKKQWAWQMGLRYIQKGSSRVSSKLGIYYKSQMHYMEIPLTIRYHYFKKVDLEAGLSLGYLIKAMEDKDSYGFVEADPSFNKFELASVFGVNYHFNDKIAFGAHLSYSITAVRPYSSGYEVFMDKGQHNNILYFTMAYKLSSWH
jgi:hypothetical protein